ncbi:MAG: FtsX-like permease family protein [Hyphomicrobiales bacterium]
MRFSFFVAKRYLISKKSHNVINIISGIALLGIAGVTAAMIIILSAMNGLESILSKQYSVFDPNILIEAKYGKTVSLDSIPEDKINAIEGIRSVQNVIQEEALFKYGDKQQLGKIKGVSSTYSKESGIDTLIIDGQFNVGSYNNPRSVIGAGVAVLMDINLRTIDKTLSIYLPKREAKNFTSLNNAFNYRNAFPSGVFNSNSEYDAKFVFIPFEAAQKLLNYKREVTQIEIFTDNKADVDHIRNKIQSLLGDRYYVKNRLMQHELEYKVIRTEKIVTFLILTFILLVASFNMTGAIMMLILEKKKDINVLRSMGANQGLIKKIFMYEGFLIAGTGTIVGLIIGSLVVFAQQQFSLVTMGGSGVSFLSEAYPVAFKLSDFIIILITVIVIGTLSSLFPIFRIKPNKEEKE